MQVQDLHIGTHHAASDPIPTHITPEEPIAQDTHNFTVCIRVRPLNSRESSKTNTKKNSNIIKIQDNMVVVIDPDIGADSGYRRDKMYLFDDVFDETHDTHSVFMKSMLPLLDNALNGYNATLFAYGMTGAGKSHTLFGELDPQTLSIHRPGLIFLTLEELFRKIHSPAYGDYEFAVKISYIEIYNEQVKDLLKGDDQNLMILEDPEKGVCVADLTETPVVTRNEVMQLILAGNGKRTMASTAANAFSSRSHAIVQVLIERREKTVGVKGTVLQSKLSLIDLAGSERAAVTENRGIRMLEGANINRSLLALGNCINILSDTNKKGAFVPYRDSKLTRLLKDSLGGNTKTIMIACISPSYMCYEETVNTLKYASRAKNIKRKLHQNVKEVELHVSQYKEIIESLKAEIDTLKGQLKVKGHEDSALKLQGKRGKIMREEQEEILEEEKKIEEASHKIFENLEQNWEINQTLRELNELEMQNRDTLQNLYQHLEGTPEDDRVYREQIARQIETLKGTMESNERIKREIANTLRGNLLENRNLKDQLVEFASSVDTLEDIELARKLLNIDKLDIVTQNTEIKKEALNLAKTRVQQNKQISQMEEEMRLMKQMLEEKERLLANNHELIQNLRSKISEQSVPREQMQKNREESLSQNDLAQAFQSVETSNLSIKEDKGDQQQTSVLKNLLLNLEKKITKSLHELDTKMMPHQEHDIEDMEVLETLRTLDNQTDRRQARSDLEKVKTFEEYYNQERRGPQSQHTGQNSMVIHDDVNDNNEEYEEQKVLGTDRTMPAASYSRRSLNKEYGFCEDLLRFERRGLENLVSPDAMGYQQTSTARTNSDALQRVNLYDKSNFTARSRVSDIPGSINPLQASRLRLPVKGMSTGILETSNRLENSENTINTVNYGDFEDGVSIKWQGKPDNVLNLEPVDPNNGNSRPYQSHELKHVASGDANMWSNGSIMSGPSDGMKTPGYLIQDGYMSKRSVHGPSVGDSSEWNLRRQSFQNVFKGKMREQSVGCIRSTVTGNQIQRSEHSRQSNSILGVSKERCFDSVIVPDNGFGNDSVNLEKKGGLEIRSLGQERENLKLFRSRLSNLGSVNVTKLSKDLVEQIRELIEEYRVKRYILSVKDQDLLRMLGEAIINYENKATDSHKVPVVRKRSESIKEETKKARSSSVRGSHMFKENKERGYAQRSKERKMSGQMSVQADGETRQGKRDSMKVLAQGVLSNLHTNYAQTVNKLAGPGGYSGRPESAKNKGNSNPQTPLQKKGLKERESNMEGKKGVNLLNMFDNQPKYYSKAAKARESARDPTRVSNDEKVM